MALNVHCVNPSLSFRAVGGELGGKALFRYITIEAKVVHAAV